MDNTYSIYSEIIHRGITVLMTGKDLICAGLLCWEGRQCQKVRLTRKCKCAIAATMCIHTHCQAPFYPTDLFHCSQFDMK